MANSVFNLMFTVNDNANGVIAHLNPSRQSPVELLQAIERYVGRMSAGATLCKVYLSTTVVQASGTITFSSFVQDDTITINGTTLTGKDSPSGASQFKTGTTDTLAAAAAAACINANTTLNKQVVATSSGAVITITALVPGAFGNLGTIAISAHGSVSGGGLLASGAQDVPTTIAHGI
jgi:phage tail sheath gpL-like